MGEELYLPLPSIGYLSYPIHLPIDCYHPIGYCLRLHPIGYYLQLHPIGYYPLIHPIDCYPLLHPTDHYPLMHSTDCYPNSVYQDHCYLAVKSLDHLQKYFYK